MATHPQPLPPGFQKQSLGNEMSDMDRLAAKFYEEGSVPALDGFDEPLPPKAVRDARAQAEQGGEDLDEGPAASVVEDLPPEPDVGGGDEEEEDLEPAAHEDGDENAAPDGELIEVPDDALFSVKVDGQEKDVTLEELRKGYQLEQTANRRLEQIAEERREFSAQQAQVTEAEKEGMARLDTLANALEMEVRSFLPSQEEVNEWRTDDPGRFAVHQQDMQKRMQLLQQAQGYRQEIEQRRNATAIENERSQLASADPRFAAATFDKQYAELGQWVVSKDGLGATLGDLDSTLAGGLPAEKWNATTDHHAILILQRLKDLSEATEKAKAKVSSAKARVKRQHRSTPRVIRPGTSSEPGETESSELAKAMAHVRENPDDREAQKAAWLAKERDKRARMGQRRSYR